MRATAHQSEADEPAMIFENARLNKGFRHPGALDVSSEPG
jgi:hypothetical protein